MKNRDKYILQRNEYDMLVSMANNTGVCPLQAVAGISIETKLLRCYKYVRDGCCEKCIQNWLNEEFSTESSR